MKALFLVIVLFFFSVNSVIAEPKKLECNIYNKKGDLWESFNAIFDTDDFDKENPKYELTKTYVINPDKIIFEKSIINPNEIDNAEARGVGSTYRYSFSATPTTMSLRHVIIPEKIVGQDSYRTYNISRKDLSVSMPGMTTSGTCELLDYNPDNAF